MRRGFKTWAEKQAAEHRALAGVGIHSPLPARVLARTLGIIVRDPASLLGMSREDLDELLAISSNVWSAVTLASCQPPIILHNTAHAPCRQESNLMHEIAHLICRHTAATALQMREIPLRSYDEAQEEEANWLGACLQVPRTALLSAIRKRMTEAEIAFHFGASVDLVRFRRNTTGVDVQVGRGRQAR